jgi:hypothetical protein
MRMARARVRNGQDVGSLFEAGGREGGGLKIFGPGTTLGPSTLLNECK